MCLFLSASGTVQHEPVNGLICPKARSTAATCSQGIPKCASQHPASRRGQKSFRTRTLSALRTRPHVRGRRSSILGMCTIHIRSTSPNKRNVLAMKLSSILAINSKDVQSFIYSHTITTFSVLAIGPAVSSPLSAPLISQSYRPDPGRPPNPPP